MCYVMSGMSLTDNDHDGIITGNGSHNFVEIMVVDVVCQTTGISRSGFNDGNVSREFYGDESIVPVSVMSFCRVDIRLYKVLFGNTYT